MAQIASYDAATSLDTTDQLLIQKGGTGTAYQRASGLTLANSVYAAPVLLSGTTNARSLGEDILDGVNIARFAGAGSEYGNGVIDDSAMFQRAAAWSKDHGGRPVYVPPAPVNWRLGTALTGLQGATFIGLGRPNIVLSVTSTVLTIAGPNMVLKNLRFTSSMASTNFAILLSEGADDCIFEDLFMDTGNSFIRTFGDRCRFSNIKAQQLYGSLIRLDGTAHDNVIYDFGGQNVQTGLNMDSSYDLGTGTGPNGNKVQRGKKWVVAGALTAEQQLRTGNYLFPTKHVYDETGAEVTTYGGDIFSCTAEAYNNTFEDNETIGSRDGSGTINGDHNIVRGHRASYGLGGGIGMFGSFNQIYGLETKYVRRGLVMMSAFGGFGSYNQIFGGHIRNSRYWGVVTSQVGLRVWVPGAAYSSRARYIVVYDPAGQVYRVYVSATGTDTFGTTRMTHESGEATDGSYAYGVSPPTFTQWSYVSKAASLKPVGNVIYGVRFENNGTTEEGISSDLVGRAHMRNLNQAENYRFGIRGFSDGVIPDSTLQQTGVIQGAVPVFRNIVGNTTTSTVAVLTTDGSAPGPDNQMVVGNTQRGRIDGTLTILDNDSQGFRDWTFSASFRRISSSAAPEFRVGSSVATPSFTQGNGTGLSWLDGITPAWSIDSVNFAIQISLTIPANASPVRAVSAKATYRSIATLELPQDDLAGAEEETPPDET